MKTRTFLKSLALGLALGAGASSALAQGAYPNRPVRMAWPC